MNALNLKVGWFWVGFIVVMGGYRSSFGQSTPYYFPEVISVDPQISVLAVGVNEQVQQAVVSHDRKYVHLDIDTTYSVPLGIQTFKYQTGGYGFVGSAAAVTPAVKQSVVSDSDRNQGNSLLPSIARSPSEILARQPTILDRPGMVLIARLDVKG